MSMMPTPTNSWREAQLAKGNKAAAATVLEAYMKAGGRRPAALERLAQLQESAGQSAGRGSDARPHQLHRSRLSTRICIAVWANCGSRRRTTPARFVNMPRWLHSIRSMSPPRNTISRTPTSKRVRRDKAEDAVLASLEAAPDYRPAQKLLLQLKTSEKGMTA